MDDKEKNELLEFLEQEKLNKKGTLDWNYKTLTHCSKVLKEAKGEEEELERLIAALTDKEKLMESIRFCEDSMKEHVEPMVKMLKERQARQEHAVNVEAKNIVESSTNIERYRSVIKKSEMLIRYCNELVKEDEKRRSEEHANASSCKCKD